LLLQRLLGLGEIADMVGAAGNTQQCAGDASNQKD